MNVKIGDEIKIISMQGEPDYTGRTGIVMRIDSIGQLHGTWGALAVIPEEDTFQIINGGTKNDTI